jgi:uncharacterized membrane protein
MAAMKGPRSKGSAFRAYDLRRATGRITISTALGLAAALAIPSSAGSALRLVAGWDVAVTALLCIAWWIIVRADCNETCRRAAAEDPGRSAVWGLVIFASGMSFFAAAVALREAKQLSHGESVLLIGLSLYAVVSAWTATHTAYTLRYAHLYYGGDDSGMGLTFPGGEQPSDMDFAYFSFCVGICYQVSDVSITSSRIRRAVLGHSCVSFAYNTVVLALALNLAFSFLG